MFKFRYLTPRTKILLSVLCAAFVGCLVMVTVPGARAALTFFSDDYVAEIQQTHIGVVLTERTGDEAAAHEVSGEGALISDPKTLLGADDAIVLGQTYTEELSAQNASSDMDEYIRLTVRKYWVTGEEAKGDARDTRHKSSKLNPAYIQMGFDENSTGDWVYSPEESTDERLVFYYKHVLHAGEAAATPAVWSIEISPKLATVKNADKLYGDCWLGLSAQVDSVQTNNAPAAAKSAWGVDVEKLGLDWTNEG